MPMQRAIYAGFCFFLACPIAAADFPGWQGLRVLEQDGRPLTLRTGDVDHDGRDEIVVVNSRYSRLEVYRWLTDEKRDPADPGDPRRPNDLPTTNEIRRDEIQLEHLPRDVLITVTDDGAACLVVLTSPPNRVHLYKLDEQQRWQQQYSVDLLDGEIPSRREPMLLRRREGADCELLIGFSDGIQRVELRPDGRARWLTPREKRDRADWWLADLDGDGDDDLVEHTHDSAQSVRWYACSEQGDFMPAQVLLDRSADSAAVLGADGVAELVLLDGTVQNLVRRYRTDAAATSPLAQQFPLPLVGGKNSAWCGMLQGDMRAIVVTDPNRPQLLSYTLDDEGWQAERSYPTIGNIQAVAAVAAQPGTLLIWAKDAADLQISRWDSERLTYPELWPQSAESQDRKILTLAQVGSTTWWIQKVGNDLDLYRWQPDEPEASRTRFADVGGKAEQALWIGGPRLLVKDLHARGLRYAKLENEQTTAHSPTQLERAAISEFKLLGHGDDYQLGRLTDGVLQLLGQDLQPRDQIMLPQGLEMSDYVAVDDAGGWALQAKAPYLHRFESDASGVAQAAERIKISGGVSIVHDHHLGLMLADFDRVVRLCDGPRRELQLLDVIDERVGRPGGVRETRIHRIGTTDVDGDGCQDLIMFDDRDHRLSVMKCVEGKLAPLIAWPVFDDKEYPYGDSDGGAIQEPRSVGGLDFDGDEHRDLAMLCHDRLIIYLGREQP